MHGSIWTWQKSKIEYQREGVQSSGRPVLIISNDVFNYHSKAVNCLTLTSVIKESPVHIPITVDVDSHIQCEQIHTIPKKELDKFRGMVSPNILLAVKEKMKIQFGMPDKVTPLTQTLTKNIEELEGIVDRFGKIADGISSDVAKWGKQK